MSTIYKALRGRGRKRGSGTNFAFPTMCRLHLAEDHLLQVESMLFMETYRRFYFADIQGILIRRTVAGTVGSIVLGLALAATVALAVIQWLDPLGAAPVFAVLAGFFALGLVANLWAGPTCVTTVFTAVGSENLGSLGHLRRARRVIAQLQALIEPVQGPLLPADSPGPRIPGDAGPDPQGLTAWPGTPPIPVSAPALPMHTGYRGAFHRWFFLGLILNGIGSLVDIPVDAVWLVVLQTFLGVALFTAGAIAVARTYRSRLRTRLLGITWAGMGYVCVEFAIGYVIALVLMFRVPGAQPGSLEMLREYASFSASDYPLLFWGLIVSGTVCLGIGGAGLLRLRRALRELPAAGAPPPLPDGPPPAPHTP
jgi:hypothetical protein